MSPPRAVRIHKLKRFLAFVLVPILVTTLITLSAGLLTFVVQNWLPALRHLDSFFLVIRIGAIFCVPVAWAVGPATFDLVGDSKSQQPLWGPVALGGGIGGIFGFLVALGTLFSSFDVSFFQLSFIVLGALLGAIHALALRYALLWLGLISPAVGIDADSHEATIDMRTER